MQCQKSPSSVASNVVPILYNKPFYMQWRLITLKEIIQIRIISSKDYNLQYMCQVYCRKQGQYLIQFDALEKSVHGLQVKCGCLTLNEMHIKLSSLIICSVNDNLTNTSSTPLPEGKKTVLYILRTTTETSISCKFNDKIFNLFKHQIKITVVLLSCGSFFKN